MKNSKCFSGVNRKIMIIISGLNRVSASIGILILMLGGLVNAAPGEFPLTINEAKEKEGVELLLSGNLVNNIACHQNVNNGDFKDSNDIYIRRTKYFESSVDVLFAMRSKVLRVSNYFEDTAIGRKAIKLYSPQNEGVNQNIYNFIIGYCDQVKKKFNSAGSSLMTSAPTYNSLTAALFQYCGTSEVCWKTLNFDGVDNVKMPSDNLIGLVNIEDEILDVKVNLDTEDDRDYGNYDVRVNAFIENATNRNHSYKMELNQKKHYKFDFKEELLPGRYTLNIFLLKDGQIINYKVIEKKIVVEIKPSIEFMSMKDRQLSWKVKHYDPNMRVSIDGIDAKKNVESVKEGEFSHLLSETKGESEKELKIKVVYGNKSLESIFHYNIPIQKNYDNPLLAWIEESPKVSIVGIVILSIAFILLGWFLKGAKGSSGSKKLIFDTEDAEEEEDAKRLVSLLESIKELIKNTIVDTLKSKEESSNDITDISKIGDGPQLHLKKIISALALQKTRLKNLLRGEPQLKLRFKEQVEIVINDFPKIITYVESIDTPLNSDNKVALKDPQLEKQMKYMEETNRQLLSLNSCVDTLSQNNSGIDESQLNGLLEPLNTGLNSIIETVEKNNTQHEQSERLSEKIKELEGVIKEKEKAIENIQGELEACDKTDQENNKEIKELSKRLEEKQKEYSDVKSKVTLVEGKLNSLETARKNLNTMTNNAFICFTQQLAQDANINYPSIHNEYLHTLVEMLHSGTDKDILDAIRNESLYREAIASVHNIIYWYYWLGLHESVVEQAEHFWQCLMSSLALRGVYIDNLITDSNTNRERLIATDADFSEDVFYLANIDTFTTQLMQAAAYLFKLDAGLSKETIDPDRQLKTLVNATMNVTSRMDMIDVCNKLRLKKTGLLKLSDVGLSCQSNGQKEPMKPAKIKAY